MVSVYGLATSSCRYSLARARSKGRIRDDNRNDVVCALYNDNRVHITITLVNVSPHPQCKVELFCSCNIRTTYAEH